VRIVHCAHTPCAGAIEALSSAVRDHTLHECRTISAGGKVGNLQFPEDVQWASTKSHALLARADIVVLHNYLNHETEPVHDYLLGDSAKKCVGFFHSHPDVLGEGLKLLSEGFPSFVVAQYQAILLDQCLPIRNVIRFDRGDWPVRKDRVDGKIRIGYAPTYRTSQEKLKPGSGAWFHCKGYDVTMPILEKLEKRKDIELCIIEGTVYDHAIRLKAECDILIDEVVTGSYHRCTLEGLALGIPTIVNVAPAIWGIMSKVAGAEPDGEFPFVQAGAEDLEEKLLWLIGMKKTERKEIGNRGRAWMEKHWHPRDIAREFVETLEQMPAYGDVPLVVREGEPTCP
jgi:hypothetical protein